MNWLESGWIFGIYKIKNSISSGKKGKKINKQKEKPQKNLQVTFWKATKYGNKLGDECILKNTRRTKIILHLSKMTRGVWLWLLYMVYCSWYVSKEKFTKKKKMKMRRLNLFCWLLFLILRYDDDVLLWDFGFVPCIKFSFSLYFCFLNPKRFLYTIFTCKTWKFFEKGIQFSD